MRRWLQTYWPYLVASLVVWLPLLRPGYVLTLDMVFTPILRLRETLTNDYGFYLLLHLLNTVLPSQLIQKVLLLAIMPLAAIGLHRLLVRLSAEGGQGWSRIWSWGVYAGSLFYAINPYTYDRCMAGQYLVLLGYALLPWFTFVLLGFLHAPGRGTTLRLAGMALLVSVVSLHMLGLAAIITISAAATMYLPSHRVRSGDKPPRGKLLRYGLLALAIFAIGSSYWLVPAALGQGSTAQTIQEFDSAHASAFATEGSNAAYRILSVLRLQGFWLERQHMFALPQDQLPGWGTVRLAVWGLVMTGLIVLWRRTRWLAVFLSILMAIGILCSIGAAQPWLTAIGYREPQKFVALIAMVFAVAVAFGTAQFLETVRRKKEALHTAAVAGALLVIVLFTPTMYWGFTGQLQASQYPADWFKLNQLLNRQPGRAIFLPWHQYMSFGFADRIIANPAPHFFDQPVIASNNPELEHIPQPQRDPLIAQLAKVVARAPARHDLGTQLAKHKVRYVILAKEFDYHLYEYLDAQKDMVVVWKTPGLTLYQNTAREAEQ